MDMLHIYQWLLQNHIVFYVSVLLFWRWLLTTIRAMYEARQAWLIHESNNRVKLEQLRIDEKRLDVQRNGKENKPV